MGASSPEEAAQGHPGRLLDHGPAQIAAGCLYRLGVALLELDRPEHCLAQGDDRIFGPEAVYEREGDVGNVTFPCGYTLGLDGDTIHLYYGATDTSVALATGSVRQLLLQCSTGVAYVDDPGQDMIASRNPDPAGAGGNPRSSSRPCYHTRSW